MHVGVAGSECEGLFQRRRSRLILPQGRIRKPELELDDGRGRDVPPGSGRPAPAVCRQPDRSRLRALRNTASSIIEDLVRRIDFECAVDLLHRRPAVPRTRGGRRQIRPDRAGAAEDHDK